MISQTFKAALVAASLVLAGFAASAAPQTAATAEQASDRATLLQYSPETDLRALAAEPGKTVVFFFAGWCPNCILTISELSENWSDVEPDITLVIADYDVERQLKAEYGVTYQDTFVLLDGEGNVAKLWNAGGIEGLNANTR